MKKGPTLLKGSDPFEKYRRFILSHRRQNKNRGMETAGLKSRKRNENSEDVIVFAVFSKSPQLKRRRATSSRTSRHGRIQN